MMNLSRTSANAVASPDARGNNPGMDAIDKIQEFINLNYGGKQAPLVLKSGVGKGVISDLLARKKKLTNIVYARQIAEVMGCDEKYLLDPVKPWPRIETVEVPIVELEAWEFKVLELARDVAKHKGGPAEVMGRLLGPEMVEKSSGSEVIPSPSDMPMKGRPGRDIEIGSAASKKRGFSQE